MINGDKPVKYYFNIDELDLLYKLLNNDNLLKSKEILETYMEKLGYSNLEEKTKNEEDVKYLKLLTKIYELLPVY